MGCLILKLNWRWLLVLALAVLPVLVQAEGDTDSLSLGGDLDVPLKSGSTTNADSGDAVAPVSKNPRDYLEHYRSRLAFRDYPGAIQDLNRVIELSPKYVPAYVYRALVEHRIGNDDDAFADCARAIKLGPGYAAAYNARGIVEMGSYRDYQATLTDFDRTLALAPAYSGAFVNRAWVKRRLKDISGALLDLNQVILLHPDRSPAYALKGCILNDLSQLRPALESFEKAVELRPSDEKSRIRIWLIRAQLGERVQATDELIAHLKSLSRAEQGQWPALVERCLADGLPEIYLERGDFIPTDGRREIKEPFCEVNYYLGMKFLLNGNQPLALDFFKKAVNTDIVGYSEYESAAMEIKALQGK